jgi:hypothetical protein
MEIAAWGEGLMYASAPFPLVRSLTACSKMRVTTLAGSMGTPPLAVCIHTSPCTQVLFFLDISVIKSQKDLDDLMGEPPGFFLHTHATFTYPLVKIGI